MIPVRGSIVNDTSAVADTGADSRAAGRPFREPPRASRHGGGRP